MRKGQGRKTILDARDLRALRRHCITYRNATVMEITTWAQEYFQKTLSVNTIHPKNPKSKKESISKHDPEAQAFSLGQGSFKTVAKWKTVLWSE